MIDTSKHGEHPGEYGNLHDYFSSEFIRPATLAERDASRKAYERMIMIDVDNGNLVPEGDFKAKEVRRCCVVE